MVVLEYIVEYAKSNRAKCRSCYAKIDKLELRVGKVVEFEEGMKQTLWFHTGCFEGFNEVPEDSDEVTKSDLIGFSALKAPDKKVIEGILASSTPGAGDDGGGGGGGSVVASAVPIKEPEGEAGVGSFAGYQVEMSKSNRARCKKCKDTIPKDVLRIGRLVYGEGDFKVPQWHHCHCFAGFNEVVEKGDPPFTSDKIKGYDTLDDGIKDLVNDILAGKKVPKQEPPAESPKKKKAASKKRKKGDESSEEEEKPKKKKAAKKKKKGDDDDDECEPPKKKKKAAPKKKKKKASFSYSDEEEYSWSDDAPKKKKKKGKSKYDVMTIPELKEELKERMLLTQGTKAELVARLEEDDKDDVVAETTVIERSDKIKPDREMPGGDEYKVYGEYFVKLNQTDITEDFNKFYIIQLLHKPGIYTLWCRWGRVGEPGANQKYDFMKLKPAVAAFKQKFKDKTKNEWDMRGAFVKHANKYTMVDVDEEDEEGEGGSALGKLSEPQIKKGQEVLHQIEAAIDEGADTAALEALSSEFFSLIPTSFGRKRPEPLLTMKQVHEKEELLAFYLRMGFDEVEEEVGLAPIAGVMDLPVPASLAAACKKVCGAGDIKTSEKKGKELEKKQAGTPVKYMKSHLYASIMLYTSNAIYADLNKVLRQENRKAIKKYFEYLRLFLEAFDHLPARDARLWRGISVDLYDSYEVGKTVTWWGVSSTTQDESVARNFMKGCGGKTTFFIIDSKTACDIAQLSFYANEKESLLAPGTILKVISKKRKGNVSEIHVEEVGRALT